MQVQQPLCDSLTRVNGKPELHAPPLIQRPLNSFALVTIKQCCVEIKLHLPLNWINESVTWLCFNKVSVELGKTKIRTEELYRPMEDVHICTSHTEVMKNVGEICHMKARTLFNFDEVIV